MEFDLFGYKRLLVDLCETTSQILNIQKHILKRMVTMSQVVDDLVLQVTNTVGVVQSATAAIDGIVVRLDALIAEEESEGADTEKLQAMRDDLAAATPDLAAAVAAVPPVNPVEPK